MELSSIGQYQRAEIIIDSVCEVGGVEYLQLISNQKNMLLNTIRGVCCLIAWEHGIHPRRLSALIRRSRANVINQTKRYRNWFKNGDKQTVEMYNKTVEIIKNKI